MSCRPHLSLLLLVVLGALVIRCGGDPDGHSDSALRLTSSAFGSGEPIPAVYTCDGEDLTPPLRWETVPPGAASLALVLKDPDAPGETFVHWLVANIPAEIAEHPRGWSPTANSGTVVGRNDFGDEAYAGPCPPPSHDAHTYEFSIFALDVLLDLDDGFRLPDLEEAMEGHTIARGALSAEYDR